MTCKWGENPLATMLDSSRFTAIVFARAAIAFALLFVVLLTLLHFMEPEFSPSWRMISEYELGHYGWIMMLAFFAWGTSVLLVTVGAWKAIATRGGRIGRWWMLGIGGALFGAGLFRTNAITDSTPSLSNTLHTLCGLVVILTFPVAASMVGHSLQQSARRTTTARWSRWITPLVWIGLISFLASVFVSEAINPSARGAGPRVYAGWPNRFMVLTYVIWLVVVGRRISPGGSKDRS